MKNDILNHLSRNKEDNISITGFFKNYQIEKLYFEGNSCILLGKSDHLWAYISSRDEEELKKLIAKYKWDTGYFASIEDWMIPYICRGKKIEWKLTTIRYILPEQVKVAPPQSNVKKLDISWSEYIFNHSDYQEYTSVEYIIDRLKRGVSACIIRDGKPVAWGLSHDDEALGFLYVLPEHRGKGYGREITRSLIIQKRQKKQSVFLNIEPDNYKSRELVSGIGFIPDRNISWLKIKTD